MSEGLINDVARWIRSQRELLEGLLAADDADVTFQTVSALATTARRSGGQLSPYGLQSDLAEAILTKALNWAELLRLIKDDEPQQPDPIVTRRVRGWVVASLYTNVEVTVTDAESVFRQAAASACEDAAWSRLERPLAVLKKAGYEVDGQFPGEIQVFDADTGESIY